MSQPCSQQLFLHLRTATPLLASLNFPTFLLLPSSPLTMLSAASKAATAATQLRTYLHYVKPGSLPSYPVLTLVPHSLASLSLPSERQYSVAAAAQKATPDKDGQPAATGASLAAASLPKAAQAASLQQEGAVHSPFDDVPTSLEELDSYALPTDIRGSWEVFLKVLYNRGYFTDQETDGATLIEQYPDVKGALLSFARTRPDIIFSINSKDIIAVAQAALVPRKQVDRKLRNADQRLKETFLLNKHGPKNHASLQDLLRVIWDWTDANPQLMQQAVPGLAPIIISLLKQILAEGFKPANPEQVAQAKSLTPSDNAEPRISHIKAGEAPSVYLQQKHAKRLAMAALDGVVEAGDWFCSVCGNHNYKTKRFCSRCYLPSNSLGNTTVTREDVRTLYGKKVLKRYSTGDVDEFQPTAGGPASASASSADNKSQAAAAGKPGAPKRKQLHLDLSVLDKRKAAQQQQPGSSDDEDDVPVRSARSVDYSDRRNVSAKPQTKRGMDMEDIDDADMEDMEDHLTRSPGADVLDEFYGRRPSGDAGRRAAAAHAVEFDGNKRQQTNVAGGRDAGRGARDLGAPRGRGSTRGAEDDEDFGMRDKADGRRGDTRGRPMSAPGSRSERGAPKSTRGTDVEINDEQLARMKDIESKLQAAFEDRGDHEPEELDYSERRASRMAASPSSAGSSAATGGRGRANRTPPLPIKPRSARASQEWDSPYASSTPSRSRAADVRSDDAESGVDRARLAAIKKALSDPVELGKAKKPNMYGQNRQRELTDSDF